MLPEADLRRLLTKVDTLQPAQAQELLVAMAGEINEWCARDGLFWLRWVKTRDEADPDNSVKPFPLDKPFIAPVWREWMSATATVEAKSRQMLQSWQLAAFCVWWARYKPNQAVYWQTKVWEDAVSMTCMPVGGFKGRCQFIEDNLPTWMRQDYKPSEGRMQYPNGSIIRAVAGGADKVRGQTISLLIEDEFAHQEDQDGVYTTVAPLIQKNAKVIFISSPNGTGNMFATLYHGRPVHEERPL